MANLTEKVANGQRPFIWWSEDGQQLAFASFDDQLVGTYPIRLFPQINSNHVAEIFMQRYPKAGTPNPKVTLNVVNLLDQNPIGLQVTPPKRLGNDLYLTHVHWKADNKLLVMWTTRGQNTSVITSCSKWGGRNWQCEEKLTLKSNIPTIGELATLFMDKAGDSGGLTFIRYPRPDSVSGTFYNVAVFADNVSPRP